LILKPWKFLRLPVLVIPAGITCRRITGLKLLQCGKAFLGTIFFLREENGAALLFFFQLFFL